VAGLYNLKKINKNPITKEAEDFAIETSKNRLFIVLFCISFAFMVLVFRLFDISLSSTEDIKTLANKRNGIDFFLQRATITDRNGVILATNLSTASLYANPQKIIDPKATIQKLCGIFNYLNCKELEERLINDKTFAWVKRHLTPREQQFVHDLGLPGLYFIREEKRVYPQGNLFAHVLGYADIDGQGLAGVEKYFNANLLENSNVPLELSVDSRIQEVVREEIANQVSLNNAIGGSGIVINVETGEVLALVSLPDYDPHHINEASDRQRFNQATLGVYEMGSTFKVFTLAMAFDGKYVNVNDAFDVGIALKVGRHQIHDFKGRGGILSVPEILMYSSNIGTAQIAMKVGAKQQRNYLKDFGFMDYVDIELPEKSYPMYPTQKLWGYASLVTISYGHGMAVTPLHLASSFSTIVNGGYLLKPTLLKNPVLQDEEEKESNRIISAKTSDLMKRVMRLVVTHGSGKRANIPGYLVAGKTGTPEKVVGKGYSKNANIPAFVGAFPINDPKYAVVVMIDEPSGNKLNGGMLTGGVIAAPVAGKIIERIAPILSVQPLDENDPEIKAKLAVEFTPRRGPLN
jgi:cell division protein FtsI (penicillin-binding protein 3)